MRYYSGFAGSNGFYFHYSVICLNKFFTDIHEDAISRRSLVHVTSKLT